MRCITLCVRLEITMQKYYQASRATFRLAYLADLVWQKLLVDRNKIERQVHFY